MITRDESKSEELILQGLSNLIEFVLIPYLLVHDLKTALSFSGTSKKINEVVKPFIPFYKLLKLLNDASRLNPSGSFNAIQQISKLIKERPETMFEINKVKMVCDNEIHTISPIQFVYHTADQYLQDILKYRALKLNKNKIREFYQHAESAIDKTLENIAPQLQTYLELYTLAIADRTVEEQAEYIGNMSDEQKRKFRNDIDEHVRTKVGTAQASLPRWILDEFFSCYEPGTHGDAPALISYIAVEMNENYEDVELNIEASLTSPTHQLGKHFALFRDENKIRADKSMFSADSMMEQGVAFEEIYENRLSTQKELFAQEMLNFSKLSDSEFEDELDCSSSEDDLRASI